METVNVDDVQFDDRGLVPAVVQDVENGDVLMMAWMNAESLARTLEEGRTVFWSRSRQELWRKGETSGHVQHVEDVLVQRGVGGRGLAHAISGWEESECIDGEDDTQDERDSARHAMRILDQHLGRFRSREHLTVAQGP